MCAYISLTRYRIVLRFNNYVRTINTFRVEILL